MKVLFPFFIGLLILGSAACKPLQGTQAASSGDPTEDLVKEMVASTLEAMASEDNADIENLIDEGAAGESFSVEVTQESGLENGTKSPMDALENDGISSSHYIWNIWGHRQYFPIGCEASAADDWAKYFGVEVNEFKFQVLLPISDNPDLGFVGDVNGPWGQVPPYAYGVHAEPVAAVLRENYGLRAVGVKNFTIDELKMEIAADQPVIAWVIGNCTWSEPYEYIDSAGDPVTVAPYEHVVIVTGYDEGTIRYMNNGKFYDIPTEYFERSWAVLGNMVIYLAD